MFDHEAFIRQLKIYLITEQTNPIIHWFERNIWKKLQITECNVRHGNGGEIVYHTNNAVILYCDDANKVYKINFLLWTGYIKPKYGLSYPKHSIIMYLLFDHYFNQPIPDTTPSATTMHPRLIIHIEELLSL